MEIADVQAEIERRVAEFRRQGRYPLGLEQQLEAEFTAMMETLHARRDVVHDLGPELRNLGEATRILREKFDKSSVKHSSRKTNESVREVAEIALLALDHTATLFKALIDEFELMRSEDERILRRIEHYIRDRVVMVDVLAQAIIDLEAAQRRNQ